MLLGLVIALVDEGAATLYKRSHLVACCCCSSSSISGLLGCIDRLVRLEQKRKLAMTRPTVPARTCARVSLPRHSSVSLPQVKSKPHECRAAAPKVRHSLGFNACYLYNEPSACTLTYHVYEGCWQQSAHSLIDIFQLSTRYMRALHAVKAFFPTHK
jgi:hypothetical protein